MTAQTIHHRGTEIKKVHISEIQDALQNKGLNIDELFGENDYCYVSDGFIRGLLSKENEPKEWHHYFVKEDGGYTAHKMNF